MHNLTTWIVGFCFTVLLLLCQLVFAFVILGPSVVSALTSSFAVSEPAQYLGLVIWVLMNAWVGWCLWPWWRRGYLLRQQTLYILLSMGAWICFGWWWGWFTGLRDPEPWFKHHISLLQHFIREGLGPVVFTFATLSFLLLFMSVWATGVWLRRSLLRWRWMPLGLAWCAGWLGFLWFYLPSVSQTFWFFAMISAYLLCLTLLVPTEEAPTPPASVVLPGLGWRDIEEVALSQRMPPTPLAAIILPAVAICSTVIALYLSWIVTTPQTTSTPSSADFLPAVLLRWLQQYQAYTAQFDNLRWFCIFLGIATCPLLVWLLYRYQPLLRRIRHVYHRPIWTSVGVLVVIGYFTYLYLLSSRHLVFQHYPTEAHRMMHSLQKYRKLPIPTDVSHVWGEESLRIEQHSLHALALFPLPLVKWGETYTMIHASPQSVAVGRLWKLQHIPPETSKEELLHIFRKLYDLQRQAIAGAGRTMAFFVFAPDTPNTMAHRLLFAAYQAGFSHPFLVIGTPHLWQHGNMEIPFLANMRMIPLRLYLSRVSRDSNAIPKQHAAHRLVHTWVIELAQSHLKAK